MSNAAPPVERIDYRSLVQKDHLGQWDLLKPDGSYRKPVVVIEKVERYVPRELRKTKKLGSDNKPILDDRGKPVYEPERLKRLKITFVGQRKAWLAGPVSQQVIAQLFGPIIQDWVGKRIQLYFDPHVKMKGATVGGIRVVDRSPDARQPTTTEQLDNEPEQERVEALEKAFGDDSDGPEAA